MTSRAAPRFLRDQLVKGFSHPIRVHVLSILTVRTASPRELAEEIDEPLNVVAYHIEVLEDLELIELIRVDPARGGRVQEHFYKGVQRPIIDIEAWNQLTDTEKYGSAMSIIRLISGDVNLALLHGTFLKPDDGHLTRTPMTVDRQGWEESSAVLNDAVEQLLDIQEKAAMRLAEKQPDESMFSHIGIMQFCLPARGSSKQGPI
jgi:DNA-binding transcriptional ArsR family regulator